MNDWCFFITGRLPWQPAGITFTQRVSGQISAFSPMYEQEVQLMLTTGATRLAVSRGQQTWYHFGSVATFR